MGFDFDFASVNYTGFNGCKFNDYVVFNGVNLTNGIRWTYVVYNMNFGQQFLIANIGFFILHILLLFYGERIKFKLRSLRNPDIKQKKEEEILPTSYENHD